MKTTQLKGFKKAFVGQVYLDKITGEELTLVAVGPETFKFNNSLEVFSLDTFELIEESDFSLYVKHPFSLEDGVFSFDGHDIETGELTIEKILYTEGSVAFLLVKSKDGEYKELFKYDVLIDEFIKMKTKLKNVKVLNKTADGLVPVILDFSSDIIIEDKDIMKEMKKNFIFVSEEGEIFKFKCEEMSLMLLKDCSVFYEKYFGSIDELNVIERSNFISITFKENSVLDEIASYVTIDDDFLKASINASHLVQIVIRRDKDGSYAFYEYIISLSDGDEVFDYDLVNDKNHSLLVKTRLGFIYTNNGYNPRHAYGDEAIEVIRTHPNFISIEPGTHKNTFTLANDKREVVKLEVIKTSDRGFTLNVIGGE